MHSAQRLTIVGFRGEAVPNEFLRQKGEADHLAVLLPGMGYTCDMPLFYYAESLLLELGADVLRVEYAYGRRPDFRVLIADLEGGRADWLFADATAAAWIGLQQRSYRRVTLVGKSLGTLAMGHLLDEIAWPGEVRTVWLTPMLQNDNLRQKLGRHSGPSLIAIGTEDPHFDRAFIDKLGSTANRDVVTVDGADHSLDIPGDVAASVRAVEQVVQALGSLFG